MYNNLRLIYITTANKEEARTIGRSIVESKLAACVNIVDSMESIYRWEGEVKESKECLLIAKTHYSKVKQLTQLVVKLHSYDCPSVLSIALTEHEGNPEYINWILETTKGATS